MFNLVRVPDLLVATLAHLIPSRLAYQTHS